MLRYIIRRVLWGVALLVIVSAVVFVIFYVLPTADPAHAARRAQRHARSRSRASASRYGLDEPIYEQLRRLHRGASPSLTADFDFGTSIFQNNEPVREIIFDRLPATILLVAGAVVLWLAIAIPVGIISRGQAALGCSTARR